MELVRNGDHIGTRGWPAVDRKKNFEFVANLQAVAFHAAREGLHDLRAGRGLGSLADLVGINRWAAGNLLKRPRISAGRQHQAERHDGYARARRAPQQTHSRTAARRNPTRRPHNPRPQPTATRRALCQHSFAHTPGPKSAHSAQN